ncbi:MAG: esterase-like activity of phytase family protein [Gemmatimonadales bacterium]
MAWHRSAALVGPVLLLAACHSATPAANDVAPAGSTAVSVLRTAEVLPRLVIDSFNGARAYNGGYGSSLAIRGRDVYLLTDRGPNFDTPDASQKGFVVPAFTPQIGVFRLKGAVLQKTGAILLSDASGKPLTGLPNPAGPGSTGETPVAVGGKPLSTDPNGVDTEGLVALADGTFWVSEEYGPHLLHVDAKGKTLERRNPFNGGLPVVFAKRRSGRAMEGLAWVESTRTLVGIMQSPLDNPKAAGRASTSVRIVAVDLQGKTTRQYLYPLDKPGYIVSEIVALSPTRFLVLELDTNWPRDPKTPSAQKRIFLVDLAAATDVSDPADGTEGRTVDGKTLEALTPAELTAAGILVASKTTLVDLLDPALGYDHNKAEGLAVIDARTIAVVNDDDFGIDSDGKTGYLAKQNPVTGQVDRNVVFYLRLATPLPLQ